METTDAFKRVSILGKLFAYYIGALLLYEFWSLMYTDTLASGYEILRFDLPLVAVLVIITLVGQGLVALGTHPTTRDHILSGAFNRAEVILIESLAIFGVAALYASIESGGLLDVTGMELYSTLLGGALSAMFEVAIVFYILRWLYIVSKSAGNSVQTAE